MRALALALAAAASVACGVPLAKLPEGPGVTAPDIAAAMVEAFRGCNAVKTLTAEIGVSGSAGGHRLRARLLAGFAAPSARLEAVAPVGAPFFIFVATGTDATLLLPRDDRALEHGRSDAVLEAIAGVRIGPSELLRTLTGCAMPDRLTNPLAFGDTWRTGAGEGGGKVYLHRESPSAPWTVATVLHSGDALQWDWRADYSDFHQGLPYRIHLVSRDTRRFDLQLTLSQVETGVLLASNVFRVQIPASAVPITLEELRRSGPLGSK